MPSQAQQFTPIPLPGHDLIAQYRVALRLGPSFVTSRIFYSEIIEALPSIAGQGADAPMNAIEFELSQM